MKEALICAMDIGEQMLLSGAEIGRVEDSIRLICSAYGCCRADVFTITSSIVVSIEDSSRKFYTQSRRITGGKTDLTKLEIAERCGFTSSSNFYKAFYY